MVTALDVSNSILKRGFDEDIQLTPMKLQKMLYLVYKSYLKETGNVLFEERFGVWKYGPVVCDIYNIFKRYKSNGILDYGADSCGAVSIVDESVSHVFKNVLDEVWEKYKKYDGTFLSKLTHKKDTAWYKAAKRKDEFLSDYDIKKEEDFDIE